MKLALAMIVKGTAAEAGHLGKCLKFAAKHVDKIFITLTAAPGEYVAPECYKICEKYDAVVSEYQWQDDFGAARNFNFAQVPKDFDYILWLDADDALREGKLMRQLVEANPKDAYAMWYQYDFDAYKRPYIVHQRVRIVRNDGSFQWNGRLHENLNANRDVDVHLLVGCDVLHLSTPKHFEANKERNLRIALRGKEEAPNDPRSYWNTGNAYHGSAMFPEALAEFTKFLETTESEEERYIACLRVAEELWNVGKPYEAIDRLRYAIGLRPMYPDAYTKMGVIMVGMRQYKDAILYLSQALKLPPPQFSIVVFNPREYDFEPIRLLAIAHYELGLIDEALVYFELCRKIYPKDPELEQLTNEIRTTVEMNLKMKTKADLLSQLTDEDLRMEIDRLKPEEASHPSITHLRNTRFIKQESSGRDLVIFCGFTQHEWSPKIAEEKGVGGSEEAVIHLAERWARLGWSVTVYNSCGYKETTQPVDIGMDMRTFVHYKPFWMWNYRDKQDVVILWRHPFHAQYEINAGKVLVDMHDVLPPGEFTKERLARIHSVMFKTQAHAELYPDVPKEKVRIVPNGIQPDHFVDSAGSPQADVDKSPSAQGSGGTKKEANLIINTSSADRSLSACLEIFAEVKKVVPEARLEWAYGWQVFDNAHGNNKRMMEWKAQMQARMQELGVVERGRLNTREVAELYQRAHVFLYPTAFYEIFCISALKAQLAGAYPVVSDFAALAEVVTWGSKMHSTVDKDTWSKPYQFDFADQQPPAAWAKLVLQALAHPVTACPITDELIKQYDWERVAKVWENIFVAL